MINVLILRAPGTNCNIETGFAFEQAGGTVEQLHVNRLLENPSLFDKFQILCFPGGFSFGDDIAAGRILASKMQNALSDALHKFRDDGKLILGICNGFQILIKSGLILPIDDNGFQATLTWNNCHRFQDRWVRMVVDPKTPCVFTKGITDIEMPMAHAEGKFVARDAQTLKRLADNGQLALRYAPRLTSCPNYDINDLDAALPEPDNPNGAQANAAGCCDETGRVFGLMPHPERYLKGVQNPQWTRRVGTDGFDPELGDGLKIFKNAIDFFA